MTLRGKVLSGLFWTGGARMASQAITWGITIVVIRTLSPGDYGLLAMATVFVNFLVLMAEVGLGAALVQAPELDEGKLRQIFGAVILIDSTLFLVLFASAPFIANLFSEERLVAITRALAPQFLLIMFSVIPVALLARRLDFKRQSLIDLASAVCGSLSTLAMALAGKGVWALVIGNLVTVALKTIGINLVSPYLKWPSFSLRGLRSFLVVGGQFTGTRVLWFLYMQADIFIAGKLLGKELLGFYSVAMHLASLPVQKISSVINQVAFPAFAQMQHSPEDVRMHLLKATRMLSFLSFPVLWGISSIAPEIVSVLLGAKWEPAVLTLQLLPMVMPLTMLSPFFSSAFQGIGRGGVVLMNVATACVVMPAAFLVGAQWGLFGLCMAWIVGFPLVFLANLQRMLPQVGLKVSQVLGTLALPALAAAGMYACVGMVRHLAYSSLSAPILMATLIASGAAGYTAISLAINRRGIREILEMFRRGRSQNV